MSFLHCVTQTCTQYWRWGCPGTAEQDNPFPWLASNAMLEVPQGMIGLPGCQGSSWLQWYLRVWECQFLLLIMQLSVLLLNPLLSDLLTLLLVSIPWYHSYFMSFYFDSHSQSNNPYNFNAFIWAFPPIDFDKQKSERLLRTTTGVTGTCSEHPKVWQDGPSPFSDGLFPRTTDHLLNMQHACIH